MDSLNEMQQKIYDYLSKRTSQDSVPPTVREIGAAVGLKSTSSVQANLESLEKKGYISRDPLLKRSIRILGPETTDYLSIPLVGTVAAGSPILAIEQVEGYIPFCGKSSKNKVLFALKVKGESMIEAGILDGDTIVVEQSPTASNGDIVVALIEDEATVKTFYRENGHIRLQPENSTMAPIILNDVTILGKVIALNRYL